MPEKIHKDKCRVTITEYDVRSIDMYGDCHDVDSFETEAEARQFAASIDAVAIVIEKHTARRPAYMFATPDVYITIATFGDTEALKAGNWIE